MSSGSETGALLIMLRGPSKIRNPNAEIRSKSEIRYSNSEGFFLVVFGFRHSNFFRISIFGLRILNWSPGKVLPLRLLGVGETRYSFTTGRKLAGGAGIAPAFALSKGAVLRLDDPAIGSELAIDCWSLVLRRRRWWSRR